MTKLADGFGAHRSRYGRRSAGSIEPASPGSLSKRSRKRETRARRFIPIDDRRSAIFYPAARATEIYHSSPRHVRRYVAISTNTRERRHLLTPSLSLPFPFLLFFPFAFRLIKIRPKNRTVMPLRSGPEFRWIIFFPPRRFLRHASSPFSLAEPRSIFSFSTVLKTVSRVAGSVANRASKKLSPRSRSIVRSADRPD